jgi:hypothetical protein
MFLKYVNKRIQETLRAKEKALNRSLADSSNRIDQYGDNISANSYQKIGDIAARSIFLRMISNKASVPNIVIAGGERDADGKLQFSFAGQDYKGAYFNTYSYTTDDEGTLLNAYHGSGIRPIAGIKSVEVSYKGGMKALRETNVSWVIGSLEDLERLTPHFLTVGKTIMLKTC